MIKLDNGTLVIESDYLKVSTDSCDAMLSSYMSTLLIYISLYQSTNNDSFYEDIFSQIRKMIKYCRSIDQLEAVNSFFTELKNVDYFGKQLINYAKPLINEQKLKVNPIKEKRDVEYSDRTKIVNNNFSLALACENISDLLDAQHMSSNGDFNKINSAVYDALCKCNSQDDIEFLKHHIMNLAEKGSEGKELKNQVYDLLTLTNSINLKQGKTIGQDEDLLELNKNDDNVNFKDEYSDFYNEYLIYIGEYRLDLMSLINLYEHFTRLFNMLNDSKSKLSTDEYKVYLDKLNEFKATLDTDMEEAERNQLDYDINFL